MDTVVEYAYRILGGVFQTQVEPVAAVLDDSPGPDALEEGRRSAAERAAAIRVGLAEIYAANGATPPSRADVMATYEAAKSLLSDLWGVVMSDARAAGPAASSWAGGVVSRAVAAGGRRA